MHHHAPCRRYILFSVASVRCRKKLIVPLAFHPRFLVSLDKNNKLQTVLVFSPSRKPSVNVKEQRKHIYLRDWNFFDLVLILVPPLLQDR